MKCIFNWNTQDGIADIATCPTKKNRFAFFTQKSYKIGVLDFDSSSINEASIFLGHTADVTGLVWVPESENLLLSSSEDFTVRLWDTRLNKEVKVYAAQEKLFSLAFIGSKIFAGAKEKILVWDYATGSPLPPITDPFPTESINILKVNPSSNLLYAGFKDNVCIIDTNAPEDDQLVDAFHSEADISTLGLFGPINQYCWTLCNVHSELSLWNMQNQDMEKSCIYRFRADHLREKLSEISGIAIFTLISLQYIDFHLYLYAGTLSNEMAIFEVKEDSIHHIINLNVGGCLSAGEKVQVFDRNFLITATDEGQVIIWEESNIVENMGLLKI